MEQISSEWQGYSFTPIQSLEILHFLILGSFVTWKKIPASEKIWFIKCTCTWRISSDIYPISKFEVLERKFGFFSKGSQLLTESRKSRSALRELEFYPAEWWRKEWWVNTSCPPQGLRTGVSQIHFLLHEGVTLIYKQTQSDGIWWLA